MEKLLKVKNLEHSYKLLQISSLNVFLFKKNQKNPECCQNFCIFFPRLIKEISVGFGNYGNLIRD